MEIPVWLELGRCDGSGDLHGYRRLSCPGDDLKAIRVRPRSGELIIDVLPELLLKSLVVLRRSVRSRPPIEVCHKRRHERRSVTEGSHTTRDE